MDCTQELDLDPLKTEEVAVVLEIELVSALTGAGDRLLRGVRGIELLRRAPCPKSPTGLLGCWNWGARRAG